MTTDIKFENGTLTVTRIYAAAIEDVFDAWIETSKLKHWWGCADCVEVRSEVETKVGGAYNHHMIIENEHGRHEAPQIAHLVEYDPPHKLAYTSPDDADPMIITVTFTAVTGGTKVHLVHANIPDMKVDGDQDLSDVIQAGWTAALGKLDRFLTQQKAA